MNNPKLILSRYGLRPYKQMGQNFLVNRHVLNNLLEAAELTLQDQVLEIGAGTGIITVELARRVKKVIAVEKDERLIPILQKVTESAEIKDRVEVICENILEMSNVKCQMSNQYQNPNVKSSPAPNGTAGFKVLGAIPYQITSPLIHKLLKLETLPQLIVLIIQNEVAEKITSQPPRANYLSNFVQSLAKVELVGHPIHPSAFWPQPKVNSRIIKIKPDGRKNIQINDIGRWEKFLHRAFSHPRKMLRNTFPTELLEKSGIEPTARPQEISLEKWKALWKQGLTLEEG